MKSSKYISILCVGSLLSLASCTDGFESDNKINGSFDDTVKEYDFQKYTTNFETIQKGIYFNYDWGEGTTWPWQTFQNLYLESQNNQKQPEISKRKSLSIRIF